MAPSQEARQAPSKPLERRSSAEATRGPGPFKLVSEVVAELRKVTWPTRQEATRLTILVLAISIAIGLILGFIDFGFARLFERIL